MLKTLGQILFYITVVPITLAIFVGLWFLIEIILPIIGYVLFLVFLAVALAVFIYNLFFGK